MTPEVSVIIPTHNRLVMLLEAIDSVYVDFTLPQQLLSVVKVGMPVKVAIEGAQGLPSDGLVAAIDPEVDSTTRTMKVRATVPNKEAFHEALDRWDRSLQPSPPGH